MYVYKYVCLYVCMYRVFRKKCVFHYPLEPIVRLHISCQRFSKLSTQRESTVVHIGWPNWPISIRPIAAQCLRGRGGKLMKILGKNTIFPKYPVCPAFHLLLSACFPKVMDNLHAIHAGVTDRKMGVMDQKRLWGRLGKASEGRGRLPIRLCTMYIDSKSNYIACWCIYLKRTLLYQNSITDRANTLYLDIGEVCQGVVGFVNPPLDTGILQAGPSIWLPSRQLYF